MKRRYWNIRLEEMIKAGIHFGHDIEKWNPKMAPYIFISSKRKGIHITNLVRTARFLSEACDLVFHAASRGKHLLIVDTGTKDKEKEADLVASAARRVRCHYVNQKWLGGMLTNWSTTEMRIRKLRALKEKMGQFNRIRKRDAAILKRQLSTLEKYLGGIQYMSELPYIVIIMNQQEESKALRECILLQIPTICLVDTNCNPDLPLMHISIPANDDLRSSVQWILNKLVSAIWKGHSSYEDHSSYEIES